MKISLLVFFNLMSFFCFSQQKNLTITNLSPQSEDYNFPLISYPNNKVVENKINTFLQVSELEFIPNSGKNPFKLAETATNSYANYVYFYGWKKLNTPSNILSIEMNGEASGAYPEGFDKWYNFDIRTGDYIKSEDVFTEKGKAYLDKNINDKIHKKISAFIKEIKAEKTEDQEEIIRIEEQISMYENCLTYLNKGDFQYLECSFEKDSLTFVRGRCSNHAMRAIDDLYDFKIAYSYQELKPHLSEFGKSLIFNQPKNIESKNPKFKLYKGKIADKYPIFVLINTIYEDTSMSATYWYDSKKLPIEWRGNFKNNHFSLIEDDYHDENLKAWVPRANIELQVSGNKLVGTWKDYRTKKDLKIELEAL